MHSGCHHSFSAMPLAMSSTFSRRCRVASFHHQSRHLSCRHNSHHSHLSWHCRRRCTQSANYCPPSIQMFKAMMAWAKCQYLRVGQCAYGSALRRCLSGAPRVEWTFSRRRLPLVALLVPPCHPIIFCTDIHLSPVCGADNEECQVRRRHRAGCLPSSLDPAQLSHSLISQPTVWISALRLNPNPHLRRRSDRPPATALWVRTSRSWLLLMKPREGACPRAVVGAAGLPARHAVARMHAPSSDRHNRDAAG